MEANFRTTWFRNTGLLSKGQPRTGTLVYFPQSFIGIVWHQQLAVLEAAVGVVGMGAGAGAGAITVST